MPERRPSAYRDLPKTYSTYRDLYIKLGTWEPWADAEQVRLHIKLLRETGATWRDIAAAAGLTESTVWGMAEKTVRVKARPGNAILAVRPEDLRPSRVCANAARWRIRSLVAMGHSLSRQASLLGAYQANVQQIANREDRQKTISAELDAQIHDLWKRLWDKRPDCRNGYQKASTTKALRMAQRNNWPTGGNLDEDRLYDPDYVPAAGWHPATGIGVA